MTKKKDIRKRYEIKPSEIAMKIHRYIMDNPGTTAGMIATDLELKHKNYVYQVIGKFENYGFMISEDNSRFYPFNIEELDNKGWVI